MAQDKPEHVYLIDGSGVLFRAFFAQMGDRDRMRRSDGTPTNAVFIFTKMLMKLVGDTDADHVAVVFDTKRQTFRNDIYPEYKANRDAPPEELIPQFPLVRDASRALNVMSVELEGYEADDLIATYAKQAKEMGADVTIVSSDKDLMQLVDDKVKMMDPMKNTIVGHDQVIEKFGVAPDKVVDVQALMGDSTDNVPGVSGIGPKAATELIGELSDLDTVVNFAESNVNDGKTFEGLIGDVEATIYEAVGYEFDIGKPNTLGTALASLDLIQRDEKDKYKAGEISKALEEGADDSQLVCKEVLRWRLLQKIKDSYFPKIIAGADMARISRDLVRLKDDVPVTVPLSEFAVKEPDPETVFGFLREQEFKSLISVVESRYSISAPAAPESDKSAAPEGVPDDGEGAVDLTMKLEDATFELVQDADSLAGWVEDIYRTGYVAVDTETTSLDSMKAGLVGVSLSVTPGRACYIPLAHRREEAQASFDLGDGGGTEDAASTTANGLLGDQIPLNDAITLLKPVLEDPSILKIGQNIKYDMQVLARYGVDVAPVDDTMLLSYVLEGGLNSHGMDAMAGRMLDYEPIKFKDVTGTGKNQVTFDLVPLDKALDYAAEDADITLRLHMMMKPRLTRDHLVTVYETLERPLIQVLERMERAGIRVDAEKLNELSNDFAARMGELEQEIHTLAGREFNVGSPKQLGEILFDEMGLSGGKKGKTGAYATGADILEGLAAEGHDLPARVLDWRQLSKLKSTYTDALIAQINPSTGRVHTSYAQAVASTGRLSSSDPNLQNIPVRTEEGRKIRQAFVPDEGHTLLSADYSQIELRLLAHVAGIDALKQAFHDGLDVHAMTASQVFGVPIDGMDPMIRRNAKAINFGIIYGISAFGLARQLGISNGEAREYIDAYFAQYPGIRQYMEDTKEQARNMGYVETLFGRRCHTPQIKDSNPNMRGFAERAAINAPIQGGAADIIKRAMIKLPDALDDAGLHARMLLQVHDELIFEVPDKELDKTSSLVRAVMENAAHLDVPLVVDTGTGTNWDEAH